MTIANKLLTCACAGFVLSIGLAAPAFAQTTTPPSSANAAAINFGDDTSEWSKDGECDDPRFIGTGSAAELVDADLMKDATDCRAAYDAGTVTLQTGESTSATSNAAINFGDDTSEWAKDGECDDPRFIGAGSAAELVDADLMKDATDCRAAYDAGTVTLQTTESTVAADDAANAAASIADIVFGDDASEYNNDQECDDPRFQGSGVADEPMTENRLHDATDCQAAVQAGTAAMKAGETNSPNPFDYGTDNSKYAYDGECDDKRFTGTGMAKKLLEADIFNDATDCRTLVEGGTLSIIPVYDPAYAAAAPYDSSGVNFGDNTSDYANDNECDDPSFQGPGTASTLLDTDLRHDRDDCRAAFEAGTVVPIY